MCVAAAALMKMNNWSLQKALQWMESKQGVKEKMRIRPSFMGQLKAYEQRLFASSSKRNKPTKSWAVAEAVPRGSNAQNSEQVVLRNTFVNQRESGRRSTPAKQRQACQGGSGSPGETGHHQKTSRQSVRGRGWKTGQRGTADFGTRGKAPNQEESCRPRREF
mmetsp:Transcript_45368/g.89358  ORF Transcript_45368/g.89358 Transcript_45368/m.89358 type:complete len:163 (+) Transcript_45368:537-1025(+)